ATFKKRDFSTSTPRCRRRTLPVIKGSGLLQTEWSVRRSSRHDCSFWLRTNYLALSETSRRDFIRYLERSTTSPPDGRASIRQEVSKLLTARAICNLPLHRMDKVPFLSMLI